MSRFVHPDLDSLSPDQRALYDDITSGPRAQDPPFPLTDEHRHLQGPFGPMLDLGALGLAVAQLGEALRFRGGLSDREREIAILLTAAHDRSSFEWYAHERVARRLGFSDDEVNAVRRATTRPSASVFPDAREAAVAVVTGEVLMTGDLSDESFAAARDSLSQADVVGLLVLIGHYRNLATVMRVLHVT